VRNERNPGRRWVDRGGDDDYLNKSSQRVNAGSDNHPLSSWVHLADAMANSIAFKKEELAAPPQNRN
jgi:hypothetical protein